MLVHFLVQLLAKRWSNVGPTIGPFVVQFLVQILTNSWSTFDPDLYFLGLGLVHFLQKDHYPSIQSGLQFS